jgi:pimeloyl-ACP methyl ester carboxylesterase
MVLKIVLAGLVVLLLTVVLGVAAWAWAPDRSRAELEALYLDAPTDMVEVDGVRLHVRDDGPREGPVVLMLHGLGSSLHTWEPWAQALSGEFRVIRIDLPGAGLSPPDPTGDYTDARTLALLVALQDRLGMGRWSLVGNSIGGRIAWTFAAAHPDRVERLVLISPDGFASPGFDYGQAPDVPPLLGLMRTFLPRELLRSNIAVGYADPAALTEPTLTRYHDLMRAPGGRAALIARMEQTVLQPPEPRLRTVTAPVLLLWGEKDAMIPFANAQDFLRVLPDARLVALPTLGHLPMEEDPAGSLPPVRAFLSGSPDGD